MAEATSSSGSTSSTSSTTSSTAPKVTTSEPTQQVIVQSTRDSELQPDALRGSEHVLKPLIEDGTLVDMEEERRDVYKQDKEKK